MNGNEKTLNSIRKAKCQILNKQTREVALLIVVVDCSF